MGVTHVTTQVFDLTKTSSPYEAGFLVDTGARDCMALEDELEKIGMPKEGESVYGLANGEFVEYELGFARIAFMGQETVSQIIFGKGSSRSWAWSCWKTLGSLWTPSPSSSSDWLLNH